MKNEIKTGIRKAVFGALVTLIATGALANNKTQLNDNDAEQSENNDKRVKKTYSAKEFLKSYKAMEFSKEEADDFAVAVMIGRLVNSDYSRDFSTGNTTEQTMLFYYQSEVSKGKSYDDIYEKLAKKFTIYRGKTSTTVTSSGGKCIREEHINTSLGKSIFIGLDAKIIQEEKMMMAIRARFKDNPEEAKELLEKYNKEILAEKKALDKELKERAKTVENGSSTQISAKEKYRIWTEKKAAEYEAWKNRMLKDR